MSRMIVAIAFAMAITFGGGSQINAQRLGNYDEIEPGLFLGGHVNEPPRGTQAVLNVSTTPDSYTARYHKWSPIVDASPAPSLKWLRDQVDFVAQNRQKGRTTYVHCFAGISRGPMVVTAYLMEKNNWTRDETLVFVRKSRPFAEPNEAFMDLLKEWETKRK